MLKLAPCSISKAGLYKRTKEQSKENYFKGMKIPKPISFKKDDTVFEIINEESGENRPPQKADKDMDIFDSQTWTLKRSNFGTNGVYQIRPRGWPLSLTVYIPI